MLSPADKKIPVRGEALPSQRRMDNDTRCITIKRHSDPAAFCGMITLRRPWAPLIQLLREEGDQLSAMRPGMRLSASLVRSVIG
jgi:hypothetical protein